MISIVCHLKNLNFLLNRAAIYDYKVSCYFDYCPLIILQVHLVESAHFLLVQSKFFSRGLHQELELFTVPVKFPKLCQA